MGRYNTLGVDDDNATASKSGLSNANRWKNVTLNIICQ